MKRLGIGLLLVLVIISTTAASCEGGEYCADGKHYEWRCNDVTCWAVCE